MEPENRQTVLDLLPKLDCIVWVVSPEKYADDVFYRVCSRGPVLQRTTSRLFSTRPISLKILHGEDPHSRFKDVLGDLTFRLRHEAGLEQPRIFCFSAARVLQGKIHGGILQDEFKRFRDFLMVKRDAKEIASLKTVNLNEGIEPPTVRHSRRGQTRGEEPFHPIGQQYWRSPRQPRAWTRTCGCTRRNRSLAAAVSRLLVREDPSIGPVRLAMRLLGRGFFTREQDAANRPAEEFSRLAEGLADNARSQIEKFSSRLDSELLLATGSAPVDRPGTATAIDAACDSGFHGLLGSVGNSTRVASRQVFSAATNMAENGIGRASAYPRAQAREESIGSRNLSTSLN